MRRAVVLYACRVSGSRGGAWRAQNTWPTADRSATLRLGGGSYLDDGGSSALLALDPSGRPTPKDAAPSGNGDLESAPGSVPTAPKGLEWGTRWSSCTTWPRTAPP
ncbi:hypothetical protein GCM10010191_71110 [Actinomadura vinacea]|uniref:Uncharacterized protein n=1 Tax=Actinomadura vinacea TaxID=115336 RepID=A0ABN3K1X0_9ACTN